MIPRSRRFSRSRVVGSRCVLSGTVVRPSASGTDQPFGSAFESPATDDGSDADLKQPVVGVAQVLGTSGTFMGLDVSSPRTRTGTNAQTLRRAAGRKVPREEPQSSLTRTNRAFAVGGLRSVHFFHDRD